MTYPDVTSEIYSGSPAFAKSTARATSTTLLGINLTDSASTNSDITVLLRGFYGTSNSYVDLANAGEPLYISDVTSGYVTYTAPSTPTYVVRLIGHTYNPSDPWVIRFNPDNNWIVL